MNIFSILNDTSKSSNRSISYMSKIVTELINYHFQRTDNDFYLYKIKRVKDEINDIKTRLTTSMKYL
jgi:hypothetical protein